MELRCSYSVPLDAFGRPPIWGEFWQYSQSTCTIPYITQYTEGTSTFYLSNTIDAGQVILIVFVIILFIAGFVKGIWGFFMK